MRSPYLLIACLVLTAAPPVALEKAGMDPARLATIPERMKSFVERGTIAGAVTLVARNGEVASFEAVGWQDIEAKKPMAKDTLFQIKSMTKPITGTAIMILASEGRLGLNDPVEKYIPEFAGQRVGSGGKDGVVTTKKASRPITIRDLLTHTSGMPNGQELTPVTGKTLSEAAAFYSQLTLGFEPGTKWLYSNTGLNTLGRIVEVVADQPFEQFVEQRILGPLGMKDTHFFPPEAKHGRIAIPYEIKEGKLVRSAQDMYRKGYRNPGPAGGLFSTAADMNAFYQMMLHGGEWNGKRILPKAAVAVMTANHTGDMTAGHGPGLAFGLTWNVARTAEATLDFSSKGTYSHGGAWGTFGWVDPAKKLVGVLMIQRVPGGARDERHAVMSIAAAAIVQ